MINVSLVSPIYIGIVGLLAVFLSLKVSLKRKEHEVSTGDGDNPVLFKSIRVHANLIENAPLAMILLLAFELQGASVWMVHVLGLAFVVARLFHVYGLGSQPQKPMARTIGSLITLIYLLVTSIAVVALSLF